MTPVQNFSQEANAAAQRYASMTNLWHVIYNQAMSANDFGTPRRFTSFMLDATAIARSYLSDEIEFINEVMFERASYYDENIR